MRDIDVLRYAERNSVTEADHKRDVLWQITLPFVVGVLVIIIFGVFVIASAVKGPEGVSLWADISLIWLILPALFFTLLATAVLGALLYGVIRLIDVLPRYTYKAQNVLAAIQRKLTQISNTAAEPVMKTNTWTAALKALFRQRI